MKTVGQEQTGDKLGRLLLIEELPAVREVMVRGLEGEGFEVIARRSVGRVTSAEDFY